MKAKKQEKSKDDSLRTVAKGGMIAIIGLFLGKIIGYFYTVLASKLGTYDYGLLSLSAAIVSFITVISLLGLDQGVTRFVAYYRGKKDSSRIRGAIFFPLKISFFVSVFLAILLFIFSNQISTIIFHDPNLSKLLKVMSLTIPFAAITLLFLAALRAFRKIEYDVGVREIAEKSIRLFVFLILFFLGFGAFGAAISFLVSAIGSFLLAFYYLHKTARLGENIKTVYYPQEMFSYSLPLFLSGIMVVVIAWTDLLMLGYFKTPNEVGIYNAVLPTASLMFILPTAIISLFLPVVIELYAEKKRKEIKRVYQKVSKWIFLTNFPIMLIMFVFSRKIIEIIFGTQYSGGSFALSILVLGYIIYSISYTSSNILNMLGKTKIVFYVSLCFAASNVILNYFLIPKFSLAGASIATSSSFLIGGFFYIFYSYKEIKLQPFSRDFAKILISGFIAIFITYELRQILPASLSVLSTFGMFILFILIYAVLLLILKAIDKEDLEILLSFKDKLRNAFVSAINLI